jgi:hypothetical protein
VAALAAVAAPAGAAPVPDRVVPASACEPAVAARTTSRAPDGPTYTPRQLLRIDRQLTDSLSATRTTTTMRTGLELRVAVHVHVIRDDDDRGPSEKRVRRQLEVLDDAFAGGQSAESSASRFTFRLASYERVHNDKWRNLAMGSAEDTAMRRALHKGDEGDLNLYLLAPTDPDARNVVLGWSTSPWQAADALLLDGVVIHEGSLPGGDLTSYDRGDTAVHEVGHWLGLLHTFEGGCTEPNDLVKDTPAEGEPSITCEGVKDTCDLPGDDPVHNFMDYAVDACMNQFTAGQVSRMTDNWLAYRTP